MAVDDYRDDIPHRTHTTDRAEIHAEEDLPQLVLHTLQRIWEYFKTSTNRFMEDYGVYIGVDKLAQLSARYPLITLAITVACIAFILPIAIVVAFTVSTLLLTFTGFFLLEGTLLTIATVLLFGCLGGLLLVLLILGIIAVTGYFGFAHIYDLFRGDKSAIKQFVLLEKLQNYNNKHVKNTNNREA